MPKPPAENEVLVLLFIAISFIVSLVLAMIFFVLFYQRRLIRHKMELQEIENKYQAKLIVANIETQEAERNRIANDLHDEVGPALSGINFSLAALIDDPNIEKSIEEIEKTVTSLAHRLRAISHNITPKSVEKFGVVQAIEDTRSKLNNNHALLINFDYNTTERFEISQELNLYRIVQELLNNTMKHAQATEVQMKLSILPDKITFTYQDNGVGVDVEALKRQEKLSLGISNLETRARALNTKIDLKSAPNQGFYAHLIFVPQPHIKKENKNIEKL
jgi:signal transduction histidine kinase